MNVLRALSGSSFGHDKECLTATFKSLIRPLLDYAAPIIYPNYSATSIRRLQLVQNRALRLITGCHSLAAIDHLHSESGVLPVEAHLRLLSGQYLTRAMQPGHVSHDVVNLAPGPRRIRETLKSKCGSMVEPYLENGIIPPGRYKETIKNIHTEVVAETMRGYDQNRVLNAPAPKISDDEKLLPRRIRTTLSQLRSGFCAKLKDLLHRIGRSDNDTCPDCQSHPASSSHLFGCPTHPTNLTTTDLWERPWEAALHIKNFQGFDDFPDIGPPPARQRPGRRPPPEPPP